MSAGAPDIRPRPHRPLQLDGLCRRWRTALDAADAALVAARESLPPEELAARAAALHAERTTTLTLLKRVAEASGGNSHYIHLTPRRHAKRLLGLPMEIEACVFNLDGVLVGSAGLHAAAWKRTFDEFVWARVERTKGRFAPFDARGEYALYLHGKPRLEGVRAFLASRGISLPEGTPDDPPGSETVQGLANRKNELLRARIAQSAVEAYDGSISFLQTVREGGLHTAVVSASANTDAILAESGLAPLVEYCVDGNVMLAEHLRAKPEPDTLLAACGALGVHPDHAAAFETTIAGVDAAQTAEFATVIAIDQFGQAAALRAHGAARVVPGLAEILETQLAA